MELRQPRPFETQGRKPTHDFLSLYSPAHQDPSPTPPDGYLETHDFLQPLERVGKNGSKEGNKAEESSAVEHLLPGGIGTYSISHISCINQTQKTTKPDGVLIAPAQSSNSDKNDENSNCSSGFSLWEESGVKKGKTGKENIARNPHSIREGGMKIGGVPWMTSVDRPAHNPPATAITSLSSSRPSSTHQNQSFADMLKSGKSTQEYEEEEEEEEIVIKKEPSSHFKGVLSVKVDTAHHDQKPNTPRSKHSATEQRRRSKINDRFSTLRELIPHGDQKRDKASLLLEVIEYIQFLQEKVHKYEDSCRGWNNEPPTMIPWTSNNERPTESRLENGVTGPASVYALKKGQNGLDSHETMKEMGQRPQLSNETCPLALQPNVYSHGCGSTSIANTASQLWQSRSRTTDCKDEELTIKSGTISISTIYSQGLLSTLTNALQSSGVDLSEAKISVQIDLGKRANTRNPILKKNEVPAIDATHTRSRLASTHEEKTDKGFKRCKTSRN